MRFPLASAGLGLILSACIDPGIDPGVDPGSLTARTPIAAAAMPCDACHAYPLADRNHDYHLTTASSNPLLNGSITCLDCHTRSIRGQAVVLFDSAYQDTATGELFYTSLYPGAADRDSQGRIIRNLILTQIDTLRQNHPIAQPERPGVHPRFREFVTALAHLNGSVDVAFNPRNSDPARFGGDSARFDPRQETCSAVACHPGDMEYRWDAPNKGLPRLPEETP